MEFSSPFTTNSSKLSAITDFLFLRKTSQALYNGMMKNKQIQEMEYKWRQAVHPGFWKPCTADQIPGVHPWGLKRSFPKPNNVPTPRAQKIVKNVPFPTCSRGSTPGKANDKCISTDVFERRTSTRSRDFSVLMRISPFSFKSQVVNAKMRTL